MSQKVHEERMEEIQTGYSVLIGKPKRRDHSEETFVDIRIILKSDLKKQATREQTGFI